MSLLNKIRNNRQLSQVLKKTKTTTAAIPAVEDATLQTWIKSIDSAVQAVVKKAVTKGDLVDIGLAKINNGNLELLIPKEPDYSPTVPKAVLNLEANGAYSSVTVDWETPPSKLFGHNAVYRSETDDFGKAIQIGSTLGDVYTDYVGNGIKAYYWVRTISKYDVEGELAPSVYAETSIDIAYLLEQLTDKINNNHFTQALKTEIERIDLTARAIMQEGIDRAAALVAERLAWQSAISSEARDRASALASEAESRQLEIMNEAFARVEGDNAVDSKIEILTSSVQQGDQQIRGLIIEEAETRSYENGVISTKLDGVFAQVNPSMAGDSGLAGDDGMLAGVWTETSARIEGDMALSERVDTVQSIVNTNDGAVKALITQEQQTRASADEAVAKQVTNLAATFEQNKESISALITAEQEVRSNQVEALAREMTFISAGVGEQFDTKSISFFDDGDDGWTCEYGSPIVLNGYIRPANRATANYLISPAGAEVISGSTYPHFRMRIRKVGSPVWSGRILYGASFGQFHDITEPVWDLNGIGIVQEDIGWTGNIGQIKVKCTDNQSAENYFFIDWIAIGRPSPSASYSALAEEQQARASADSASMEAIRTLTATVNDKDLAVKALIVEEQRTRADETGALSTDIRNLSAEFENSDIGGLKALITQESETRADETGALAQKIDGVIAQTNPPSMAGDSEEMAGSEAKFAGTWSETSARIEGDMATTERIDTFYVEYNDNKATIEQKFQVVASDKTSTAKSIQTLQSDLGSNTSQLQQTMQVVDGINAEWKIKVQAGGKISGVSLGTTGTESQFLVLADRFAVGQTVGTTTVYPFIIDQGKVVMNTVVIKDGSIASAKLGNLSADKITSGDIAADRMKANIVQAVEGKFTTLSALSAKIGVLRTATTGARTEIKDNLIEVYDASGQVRVRLGVWD